MTGKKKQKTLFDHFRKKQQTAAPPQADIDPPVLTESVTISTPINEIKAAPITVVVDLEDPPLPASQDGSSQHDPIVILDSSPIKPTRTSSTKTHYPIFAPRQKPVVAPASVNHVAEVSLDAPFPTKSFQHVRGEQHSYSHSKPPFEPRIKSRSRASSEALNVNLSFEIPGETVSNFLPTPAPTEAGSYLSTIPPEHQLSHPAIYRMVQNCNESTSSAPAQKLWTDKYRPTRADDVLGNENHAIYLRKWLQALQVQFQSFLAPTDPTPSSTRGTKRASVVRDVTKRGRKKRRIDSDDEQDWIVDDHDQPDEEEFIPASLGQADIFGGQLTNTILLTGPPGSGKTSAVYACAEELGWEVFEVYPGIGKRNGANLDNLVGEVGKNHLVGGSSSRVTESPSPSKLRKTLTELLGDKQDFAPGSVGQHLRDISGTSDLGFIASSDEGDLQGHQVVRQSLILLEEVDILFKEDANFWPAVISLIRKCKRPVICTCNDISLVPLVDLPIQVTLDFRPCPPAQAISYLQSLCHAEAIVAKLFDSMPDLRRSINHLQLWLPVAPWFADPRRQVSIATMPLIEWHRAELLSFTDSYLVKGGGISWTTVRSTDDELGHMIFESEIDDGYGNNDRDQEIEMIRAAIPSSRGNQDNNFDAVFTKSRMQSKERLRAISQNGAVPGAHFVNREIFQVDYLPWLRFMVETDDKLEAEVDNRQKRTTRRSRVTTQERKALEGLPEYSIIN
ncbi:P-loop containing nucleoside triphosphate hydrolase protein [Mycena floridula]|nr:P-loop containing nucleoside triphosphate hydrolase protein [Mycena floridula]